MEITLYVNDDELGPFPLNVVQEMLGNGEVNKTDWAWFDGCEDYVTVGEIPGIESSTTADKAEQGIYLWPEDAEDWMGPYTLSQVKEQLVAEEISLTTYAVLEGGGGDITVADLPGIQGQNPVKAKKHVTETFKQTKKDDRQKKTTSGKNKKLKNGAAQKGKSGKTTGRTSTTRVVPKTPGTGGRFVAGAILILALGINIFIGMKAPESAADLAKLTLSSNPFETEPDAHTKFHSHGLFAAAGLCLVTAVFCFLGKGGILVSIVGLIVTNIGIWGIVATFMGTTPLFLATGLCNLSTGLLSLIASKACK